MRSEKETINPEKIWLGTIPERWTIAKFKYFARIRNGKDQKGVLIEEGGYPVLGTGGEFGRSSESLHSGPSVLLGRKGTIDKPQYIESPFWTVDTLFYTDIYSHVNPKFLFYCSLLFPFQALQESSAVPSMTQDKLNQIYLPVIELSEQIKIANYLDYKTTIIDKLITDKERLIKLLQEQRQATINEAVTKGLDPMVKMKDSGIEWLGEVPENWEVTTFQRYTKVNQGLQIAISERLSKHEEGAYEYITVKSIHNPNDYRQYVLGVNQSVICHKDEILMSRTGNTGEIVTGENGVFHNNFFKIDFNRGRLSKDFLVRYLNHSSLQENIQLAAGTTTIPDLNHGDFYDLPLVIPPISIQLSINKYVDERVDLLESVEENARRSLDSLKSYRQAIISEAVTGKIDLREWKEPKA